MHGGHVKIDSVVGLGAALNVPLGFVPRRVELHNATSGAAVTTIATLQWSITFASGGTNSNVISPGDRIKGATSGAIATVESVLLASGSFAAGTAAGFFTVLEGSLTGTFQAENVTVLAGATAGTTTAATVVANVITCTQIAANGTQTIVTGTSAISRLEGVAGTSGAGFTIGSSIAPAGNLLRYVAYQGD